MRARLALSLVSVAAWACQAFDAPPTERPASGVGRAPVPTMPQTAPPTGVTVTPPSTDEGPVPPRPSDSGDCSDCGSGCPCEIAPWKPPFESVGADGWRDSSRPLCMGIDDIRTLDVWSDGDTVFVMASGFGNRELTAEPDPDSDAGVEFENLTQPTAPTPRARLLRNSGIGWQAHAEILGDNGVSRVRGLSSSAQLLHGAASYGQTAQCHLIVAEAGGLLCAETDPVTATTTVDDSLAYAITVSASLRVREDGVWRTEPEAAPIVPIALWADRSTMVAVDASGSIAVREDGAWSVASDGVVRETFTAAWIAGPGELWAGGEGGRLWQHAAEGWREVAVLGGQTCATRQRIAGIVQVDGVVYAHTDTQLARWNGERLETLGNWTCSPTTEPPRIAGIWAVHADDLFAAIVESTASGCGPAFLAHYDGDAFHRL